VLGGCAGRSVKQNFPGPTSGLAAVREYVARDSFALVVKVINDPKGALTLCIVCRASVEGTGSGSGRCWRSGGGSRRGPIVSILDARARARSPARTAGTQICRDQADSCSNNRRSRAGPISSTGKGARRGRAEDDRLTAFTMEEALRGAETGRQSSVRRSPETAGRRCVRAEMTAARVEKP